MRPNGDFPPRMKGATGSVAGRRGLVPKPTATDNVKYLKGDGSWSALSNASAATNAEAAAGISTTTFVTPANAQYAVANKTNTLAPAQALSFNGTAGSTIANVPAFGTGDFSVVASGNVSVIGAVQALVGGAVNSFALSVDVAGYIYARKTGVANLATSTIAIAAGQVVHIAYNRSGTTGTYYINGVAAGTVTDAQDYSVACTQLGSTAGTQFLTGPLRLLGVENYALSPAQQTYVYQTGSFPASEYAQGVNDSGATVYAGAQMINGANSTFASDSGWWTKGGSASIAAGVCTIPSYSSIDHAAVLKVGKRYRCTVNIISVVGGLGIYDGATVQSTWTTTGPKSVEFTATGTQFMIGSSAGTGSGTIDDVTLVPIGLLVCPDWAGYAGGPQVIDVSGIGADIHLPGDGVTGGVVPALPGATPSPFRAIRTSSGYLIGDQVVIPPGCSVEIWAKGNGTFSLGDSSGTPASIVNAQTAPTNLSPIAQGGYVTATRKLYLTLGSATSVTVRVNFKSA